MEKRANCHKYKTNKKRKYRWRKRMNKRSSPFEGEEETASVGLSTERADEADVYNKGEISSPSQEDDYDENKTKPQDPNDNDEDGDWLYKPAHTVVKKCNDCKFKEQHLQDEIEHLEWTVKKKDHKIDKLERSDSYHHFYYRMAKGFESKIMYETMEEFVSQRTLEIAGTATHEGRLASDLKLLQQGVIIIPEDEITSSVKLGNGVQSFVFKAKYKGMDVAAKCFMGQHESMLKEYQILTILNSHPNIPYPYGLVNGRFPKLITSHALDCVPLTAIKLDCESKLATIVSGLISAVSHIHCNDILHNNINHKNIVVNINTGSPTLVGFSHACLHDDAYIIPQIYLETFGKECCLPSKVKDRLQKVSTRSDLFCLGFTVRWHVRSQFFPDSTMCQAVSTFAAECMGLVKDRRMSNERLEEALGRFAAWANSGRITKH